MPCIGGRFPWGTEDQAVPGAQPTGLGSMAEPLSPPTTDRNTCGVKRRRRSNSYAVKGCSITGRARKGGQMASRVWRSFGVSESGDHHSACRKWAMGWRVRCGDEIACSEWRSFGVPKVLMEVRVRSGEQIAGVLRQCNGVSEEAIEWLVRRGDGIACCEWQSVGVSEVAMDLACSEWRSVGVTGVASEWQGDCGQ